MRAVERGIHGAADCSDAGMAYFLVTGDEHVDSAKLKRLLDEGAVPVPVEGRPIRMEAENFRSVEGMEFVIDRTASQRGSVRRAGSAVGRMRTTFIEPYTADRAEYDVLVRYASEEGEACRLRLFVNGEPQDAVWDAPADERRWRNRTIRGVTLAAGDEILLEIRGEAGGRLDYVELTTVAGSR
jgi:hypothetical protein